jgi:hypothetical protein
VFARNRQGLDCTSCNRHLAQRKVASIRFTPKLKDSPTFIKELQRCAGCTERCGQFRPSKGFSSLCFQ